MKWSKMLIPTVKEVPSDAEIPSHRLMIRAGMIRKLASGTYTYMPLGWRSLLKIMRIVRQEMDSHGGQEISMPILQPMELWQASGRDVVFDEIMSHFTDRHGRVNALAPTAEEVVTHIAAGEISSYRQLPLTLYQINSKFRDEFRPRFGVIRSREFIMKDAYSFHASLSSLDESYRQMSSAYCRIFDRCGLRYTLVEAESGGMGGSGSQEFMVACPCGEDTIVTTSDGGYSANLEKAQVDPVGRSASIDEPAAAMEEVYTPGVGSIEAVCDFLKSRRDEMIKTLFLSDGENVVIALVRGDHELNEFKLAIVSGVSGLEMADESVIYSVTGSAVGFAGPVGLSGKVDKVVIDHAVAAMSIGITGANKSDYHIRNIVPGRDFSLSGDNIIVSDIRNAVDGDTWQGGVLNFSRGVEVGHVFKLGTKYSVTLGATFLDEAGQSNLCIMGCYGIGINRILAAAIELGNDSDGIIWPISISPFEVLITSVNQDDPEVSQAAEGIYSQLKDLGVDVLLDDRPLRGGVKFKDADLIGIPIRITVGKRSLANGEVQIKLRRNSDNDSVSLSDVVTRCRELIGQLYDELDRQ